MKVIPISLFLSLSVNSVLALTLPPVHAEPIDLTSATLVAQAIEDADMTTIQKKRLAHQVNWH
jgi:hypothetical protein